MIDGDYWNETRAAKYLDISPKTLQKYRTQGGGPKYYKLFGRVRYTKELLDEFVKAGLRENTGQGG